jgi:Lrp/AsnC family transcriptional regulator, leucine-responsive regulatory protein
MIDATDRQILDILQKDARTSNAEVARRVGMAPSAVSERIRKLEERGVIAGYSARLNARALGLGLLAFVLVRSDEKLGAPETEARLAEIPEAQEVHHIAGEDCFLVKVRLQPSAPRRRPSSSRPSKKRSTCRTCSASRMPRRRRRKRCRR